MKFRIVEIKRPHHRHFFRPEYKRFLCWRKLGDSEWAEHAHNHKFLSGNCRRKNCLYTLVEAEEAITDFKKWLIEAEEFKKTHKVK